VQHAKAGIAFLRAKPTLNLLAGSACWRHVGSHQIERKKPRPKLGPVWLSRNRPLQVKPSIIKVM
jgi:hypothetical protein